MPEPPERIDLDDVDLGDPRAVEHMSYIVMGGDVYRVTAHDYCGERYLELVDEIPDAHWERYSDTQEPEEPTLGEAIDGPVAGAEVNKALMNLNTVARTLGKDMDAFDPWFSVMDYAHRKWDTPVSQLEPSGDSDA